MPRAAKARKLRLYVWEGVFTDYTSGMAAVLAFDVDHARRLLRKELGDLSGYMDEIDRKEPTSVGRPAAFFVAGGG